MSNEKPVPSELAKRVIGHSIEGYMDYVDFMDECGQPFDGNTFYADLKNLKKAKRCVNHCGIVKVKIILEEWIQLPTGVMAFKDTSEYEEAHRKVLKRVEADRADRLDKLTEG